VVITCGCAACTGSAGIGRAASSFSAAAFESSLLGGAGVTVVGALLLSRASCAITIATSAPISPTTATTIPNKVRPARRRA
jgi:hypothetical protein